MGKRKLHNSISKNYLLQLPPLLLHILPDLLNHIKTIKQLQSRIKNNFPTNKINCFRPPVAPIRDIRSQDRSGEDLDPVCSKNSYKMIWYCEIFKFINIDNINMNVREFITFNLVIINQTMMFDKHFCSQFNISVFYYFWKKIDNIGT